MTVAANVKKNFLRLIFRPWSAGFQRGMMLKPALKRRAGGRRSN